MSHAPPPAPASCGWMGTPEEFPAALPSITSEPVVKASSGAPRPAIWSVSPSFCSTRRAPSTPRSRTASKAKELFALLLPLGQAARTMRSVWCRRSQLPSWASLPRWRSPQGWPLAGRKAWMKPMLYVTTAAVAVYLVATLVPVKEYLTDSMTWIQANPTLGAILLPLILCVGIPLCIPSPGFEILAGSMFGIVYGVLLSVIGKTAGQLIAFSLGKRFGKDRISGYMQANFPAFAALAMVLQNSNWKPLLLIQVANVPHLVKCYGLALADIPTHRFMLSSLVGGLPYAILWAYIGYNSKGLVVGSDETEVNRLGETSLEQRVLIGAAGTVFTVVAMAWLVVYTKRELNQELQKAGKLLHRSSEDSDDTCITISSSDEDDEAVASGLLKPQTSSSALTTAQPRGYV